MKLNKLIVEHNKSNTKKHKLVSDENKLNVLLGNMKFRCIYKRRLYQLYHVVIFTSVSHTYTNH